MTGMYPHRIRLRGPWECTPLSRSGPGDLPPPLRVTMPCHWGDAGLAGFAGRVRFVRRFGYPGRIDEYERVWLTFAGVEGTAAVCLNGQVLGTLIGPGEFEITTLLRDRNELIVEVEADGDRGGLWGEVALEVRRTAFLKDVTACWSEAEDGRRLQVSGHVAGHAGQPLELYAVLGRSNVAYAVVAPGRPFLLTSELLDPPQGEAPDLRVELVGGAVVWYATLVPVAGP